MPGGDVPKPTPRVRFFRRLSGIGRFALIWLSLATAALLSAWASWNLNNWSLFWIVTIGYYIFIPTVSGLFAFETRPASQRVSQNPLLRSILANAGDRIAPIEAVQPAPLDAESGLLAQQGEHFDSLAIRMKPRTRAGCLSGFLVVVGTVIFSTNVVSLVNFTGTLFLLFLAFFAPMLPITLIFLIISRWRARHQEHPITVDDSGITWYTRGSRQAKHIAWSEAQAFLRSAVMPISASAAGTTPSLNNYLLVSAQEIFTWTVPLNPSVAVLLDSDRLTRIIVTRTGLPLRDVTLFANELGTMGKNLVPLVEARGLTRGVPPEVLQEALTQQKKSPNPLRVIGVLLLLCLILVPFAVGGGLQYENTNYYAAINHVVTNETPTYHDPLNQDDGNWSVTPISPQNTAGSAYVNGAYELHGTQPNQTEQIVQPYQTFGSAAYAVTAVETGTVPDNESDGIGLIVHANADQSDFLVFYVQYSGAWDLYHYHEYGPNDPDNWEYIDDGTSSAIHQGPGAANRLMIVTYPDTVALYANGQFLYHYVPFDYRPIHADFGRSGSAGVFLNSQTMTGDFTDFTVSPAPPTDFWSVVQTLLP